MRRRAITAIAAFVLALAVPVPACQALVEGQGHRCAVDSDSGDHLCCAHLTPKASPSDAPVLEDAANCSTELRVLDPATIAGTSHSDNNVAVDAVGLEARPAPAVGPDFAVPAPERAGPAPPLFILYSSLLI